MGAGRKPGSPNKATLKREAEYKASGLTPLDYMISLLRDTDKPEDVRLDAAKSAAPYVHPRLASIDANITGQITIGAMLDAIDASASD